MYESIDIKVEQNSRFSSDLFSLSLVPMRMSFISPYDSAHTLPLLPMALLSIHIFNYLFDVKIDI